MAKGKVPASVQGLVTIILHEARRANGESTEVAGGKHTPAKLALAILTSVLPPVPTTFKLQTGLQGHRSNYST